MRAPAFAWALGMAETGIPESFSVAIRLLLWAVFGFIFALVGWEKFWEGDYVATIVNAALLAVVTFVAVKWHEIARFFGERRVTALYIGIGLICAIGLGFSVGKLMGRTPAIAGPAAEPASTKTDTGRIAWNFEEAARGLNYFLGFNRQNQEEVRISGFAGHGRNLSADPITQFKGYVRSDVTNEQWPIYLLAEDPNAPAGGFNPPIPTLPEETFGIPASAEFNITTFNKTVFEGGKDGIPWTKFFRDFAPFTLVLEYDGNTYRRQFTREEIQGQYDLFERQTNRQKNTAPRVVRRPTAAPPIEPTFPFHVPEDKPPAPSEQH